MTEKAYLSVEFNKNEAQSKVLERVAVTAYVRKELGLKITEKSKGQEIYLVAYVCGA